jgi:hypothetical protein
MVFLEAKMNLRGETERKTEEKKRGSDMIFGCSVAFIFPSSNPSPKSAHPDLTPHPQLPTPSCTNLIFSHESNSGGGVGLVLI